jgi:hypothetical protein
MSQINVDQIEYENKVDCVFNENCHVCLLRKKRYLSYIRKRRENAKEFDNNVKKKGFFVWLSSCTRSCTLPWNVVF